MQYTLAVGDINQLDENLFGGFLRRRLLNVLTVLVSSAADELASAVTDMLGSTVNDSGTTFEDELGSSAADEPTSTVTDMLGSTM